jgi:hypothetical protein
MNTSIKQNEEEKNKVPLQCFLVAEAQLPPRQHLKSKFFKNYAFKKKIMHKLRRRPIIDHMFSPWKNNALSKQCIQQDDCHTQSIKTRL